LFVFLIWTLDRAAQTTSRVGSFSDTDWEEGCLVPRGGLVFTRNWMMPYPPTNRAR